MTNKRVDLDHLLSEASELAVWAGRPAVLEEVHRLQTRWDQLASGSVSRRENIEVELKVCMKLLILILIYFYSINPYTVTTTKRMWNMSKHKHSIKNRKLHNEQ